MATPKWIQYREYRTGASDPNGDEDVYNRPNRTIYELFNAQHNDDDGSHASGDFLVIEEGDYTGDGVDPQVVSLTNSNMDIFVLIIAKEGTEYPVIATLSMTADNTKEIGTNAFQSDQIQDIATTGQFSVGGDGTVNTNLATYHYLAIGVGKA